MVVSMTKVAAVGRSGRGIAFFKSSERSSCLYLGGCLLTAILRMLPLVPSVFPFLSRKEPQPESGEKWTWCTLNAKFGNAILREGRRKTVSDSEAIKKEYCTLNYS